MANSPSGSELWRLSATEVASLLKLGEISPLDLVEAAAQRIAATEPHINALPTLCLDRARAQAKRLTAEGAAVWREEPWLGGLPIAVKDLVDVAGVRSTQGSPIFADHHPERSDILVETLEQHGAIVVGKSNTPEFGAGASTFNEVFGITRNPWRNDRSVAGSSGGAAAALAAGQVWLADGSDLGGSLRTPASFNGVIGLRPSPGRVSRGPRALPFGVLPVAGPMGRTARDVALGLDAMSAWHPADPYSLPRPPESFRDALEARRLPKRIAYSPNLGLFPVDGQVAAICAAAAQRFAEAGIVVEEACPDFSGAVESFQVLRAAGFAADLGDLLRERRQDLKPEVIWNIEKGQALTAEDIGRAEQTRGRIFHDLVSFFEDYDLLLTPTAIVPPFAAEVRYVEEVEGRRFDNYIEWVGITFALTLTGCPVLSAPAGLTDDGLPVGLQIVGPPQGEAAILTAALVLEELTGLADLLPIDPRDAAGQPLPLGRR